MVAWPPTAVAWPFSDFFQYFSELLETSQKRCWIVGRRSSDLRSLSSDRQRFLSKFCHFGWNVENMLFESQRTVAWPSGYFFLVVVLRTTPHTLVRGCISRSSSSFRRTGQHSAYFHHLTPPNGKGRYWVFDTKWKIFLGRRKFFILAGILQLAVSL